MSITPLLPQSEVITIFQAGGASFTTPSTFTRTTISRSDRDPAVEYAINTPILDDRGFSSFGTRQNLLLNNATLSTQSVTVTAAAHTLSFYGTGTVTLSGVATDSLAGTGVNDVVTLTFTPTAGSLTLTVTGSVTSAVLELGLFRSTNIPTAGTAVTRGDDTHSTALTAIPQYNATQGTFLVRCTIPNGWVTGTSEQGILHLSDGTNNNRMQLSRGSNGQISFFVNTAGVNQASVSDGGGVRTTARTYNIAITYGSNYFAICTDGATPQEDTSGTVPTVTTLFMGRAGSGAAARLFGTINFVGYIPRLTPKNELPDLIRKHLS